MFTEISLFTMNVTNPLAAMILVITKIYEKMNYKIKVLQCMNFVKLAYDFQIFLIYC